MKLVSCLVFLALPVLLLSTTVIEDGARSCSLLFVLWLHASSLPEFSCGDGGCVSAGLVCDGSRDCTDGGDELGCDTGLIIPGLNHSELRRIRRQGSDVDCGTVILGATPLISGADPARRGEVPWHAGIYDKTIQPYKQLCGGALVRHKVVLSAAHCFWDELLYQLPAANYAVAVGKLYRDWGNSRDIEQQSDVKEIHIPEQFQGNTASYQADIAVVIVKSRLAYTNFIRPVCLDFDHKLQGEQLTPGNSGKVAGWGITSQDNNSPSQSLRVLDLPYISTPACISSSPHWFRGFITVDKFCAGFKNAGKAVCKGDSGGGLAFRKWEGDILRFYLRGIVSTAPQYDNSACSVNDYTTFTLLLSHEQFITQFLDVGDIEELNNQTGLDVTPTVQSNQTSGVIKVKDMSCKNETIGNYVSTPLYAMNNETFNHVRLKRDEDLLLKYFEIHIAIQAEGYMDFLLLNKKFSLNDDSVRQYRISIGDNKNTNTNLYYNMNGFQQSKATPNILSGSEMRYFYVKVDDGLLKFGKENVSTAFINYYDEGLRTVKYFQFGNTKAVETKVRYDCPPPVEVTLCKEETISKFTGTPQYSMDNQTFNYVKLQRDSAGLLTYFEIHIAIQTHGYMHFFLFNKVGPGIDDSVIRYDIHIGDQNNQNTGLFDNDKGLIQSVKTPDILTEFYMRYFYVKVDNGTLQFGQEGNSTPIISYSNDGLRSVKYFKFDNWRSDEKRVRYDCPPPAEGDLS